MKEIQVIKDTSLMDSREKTTTEILTYLEDIWVDNKMIALKLKEWLNAKTLNAKWDVMEDSRAQQKAFEYIMKMKWIKMDWWWTNFNFFNIPNPNEPIKY